MNFFKQALANLEFLEPDCPVLWTHLDLKSCQALDEKSSTRDSIKKVLKILLWVTKVFLRPFGRRVLKSPFFV